MDELTIRQAEELAKALSQMKFILQGTQGLSICQFTSCIAANY